MDFQTLSNMMKASASAALAIATSATPPVTHASADNGAAAVSSRKQAEWANDFTRIDLWRTASSQYTAAANEATQSYSGLPITGAADTTQVASAQTTNNVQQAKKLSNLEHFQLGSQFETEGNFAAACLHYSLAVKDAPTLPLDVVTPPAGSVNSNGDVYLSYPTKLAIEKRIAWLRWAQTTNSEEKKLIGLRYITLLFQCRSDNVNANDDLLGATHCLNSMGLLEQAKSCYEHYVNGVFEPSDKILTRCCNVPDDILQNIVEKFQLNLDAFPVTTAIDHEGLSVPTCDDGGNDDGEIGNSIACESPSKQPLSKFTRRSSHAVSSGSDVSSTSSGNGRDESSSAPHRHERPQQCVELGFDASASLLPLTPRRSVLSHDDAHSNELRRFCYSHPVAVLRNMHAALNMNLVNYSTKAIVDVDADCPIEERTQLYQPGDMNLDLSTKQPSWDYYSEAGSTTVKNISLYQLQHFLQQNRSARPLQVGQPIHFGTNLDLSDTDKWHAQLGELDKLPSFLRVTADTNMLSYIDYELLGVNTVQMYIKVGGNRTPGHQENNNFCSVNLNIGPGDCEWFCVDFAHWEQVRDLCQQNDLDFLKDAWWPFIDDLTRAGVPVYKFTQKPGDVVWVNIGTVHWVQALSVCNNIAWNVGPLTAYQLKVGIERYEYNRIARFQSIIPMTYLIWSLAQNGGHVINRNGGAKLFSMLKTLMRQSLEHCQLQLRLLDRVFEKEVHLCDPTKISSNKRAQYCWRCESEVYNILYCLRKQKARKIELETYCYRCAIADDPKLATYTIMQQYDLKQLCMLYEKFRFDYGGGKNSIAVAVSSGILMNGEHAESAAAPVLKEKFDATTRRQPQGAMSPVAYAKQLTSGLTSLASDTSSFSPPAKKRRVSTNKSVMGRTPVKMPIYMPIASTAADAVSDSGSRNMPIDCDTSGAGQFQTTPSSSVQSSPVRLQTLNNSPVIRSGNNNKRTHEHLNTRYSMLSHDDDDDDHEPDAEKAIAAEMDDWHAKKTAAAEKRAVKGLQKKQRSNEKVGVKSKQRATSPVIVVAAGRTSADFVLNVLPPVFDAEKFESADKMKNGAKRGVTGSAVQRSKQSNNKRERESDDDAGDAEGPESEKIMPRKAKRHYKRKRPNDIVASDADIKTADKADDDSDWE